MGLLCLWPLQGPSQLWYESWSLLPARFGPVSVAVSFGSAMILASLLILLMHSQSIGQAAHHNPSDRVSSRWRWPWQEDYGEDAWEDRDALPTGTPSSLAGTLTACHRSLPSTPRAFSTQVWRHGVFWQLAHSSSLVKKIENKATGGEIPMAEDLKPGDPVRSRKQEKDPDPSGWVTGCPFPLAPGSSAEQLVKLHLYETVRMTLPPFKCSGASF